MSKQSKRDGSDWPDHFSISSTRLSIEFSPEIDPESKPRSCV